jgi:hypothetical protein
MAYCGLIIHDFKHGLPAALWIFLCVTTMGMLAVTCFVLSFYFFLAYFALKGRHSNHKSIGETGLKNLPAQLFTFRKISTLGIVSKETFTKKLLSIKFFMQLTVSYEIS